jgi:arsenate reductase
MAEGYIREFAGDRFDVYSAGTDPAAQIHPLAVKVMADAGIDISTHRPKNLTEYLGKLPVRYAIVVCSSADEQCPRIWPGMTERLFWPFDDPAAINGTDDQKLQGFVRVRDEIRTKVLAWVACSA